MTKKQFGFLKELREIFSVLGWLLMVLNFAIGIVCIVVSIATSESILGRPGFVFTILSITLVVGLLAIMDREIYKRLRNSVITDQDIKNHL